MKDINRFLNSTIKDVVGRGVVGEMFGVELELEGRGVMMDGVAAKGWKRTHDGSLRGESVEYVFINPCGVDAAKNRVSDLFDKFKKNDVDIKNSYRTSTHVHLNFGDKSVKQLLSFFTLFTMLEDMLERYSGEDRAGNLFCLSSRRGEAIIEVLSDCILKHQDFSMFADDRYKYAACNLSTLYKFGTAEVRTMRGADSAMQVNMWIDMLNQVYVRALQAKTPIEFIENVSILGPDGFLADVFTNDVRRELIKGLPFGFDFRASLMEGARLCQMFVYEIGDEFLKEAPKLPEFNPGAGNKNYILPGAIRTRDMIYSVYVPRKGIAWDCQPRGGLGVFTHGVACTDDLDIVFDENIGRFQDLGDGGKYLWFRNHPHFGNEYAANRDRKSPYCPVGGFEDVEIEHDDYNEDED